MARRPTLPPPLVLAALTPQAMAKGIAKLERRIRDLREIDVEKIQDFWSEAQAVATRINSTLAEVFGAETVENDRAHIAHHFFTYSGSFSLTDGSRHSRRDDIQAFQEGIARSVKQLQTEIEILREKLADENEAEPAPARAPTSEPQYSDDEVFIVHGQDDAAKQETARFIEACGLKAKILHELDNRGNTIIEKLERHTASIGFAVVLLTPDDVGGPKGGDMKPRARQNVVAELFYFVGKLGRDRVVALKKGDVEIPSDLAGVVYVDMDARGAWKQDLVRELKAAGYKGDWSKALFG